jgi:endosialidase-like protein
VEPTILGTGTATFRQAIYITAGGGTKRGATRDTAILVQAPGTSGAEFGNFVFLSGNLTTGGPLSSSGNFVTADVGSTYTLANFINLPGMIITGNILSFPNVTLTGAGALTINGVFSEIINQNAGTVLNINNNSTGTAASAGISLANSANFAAVSLTSTGWTGAPAIIGANTLVIRTFGASSILIDTNNASPIIFGQSDTEIGRWTNTGQWNIGTAAPIAGPSLVVNQNTLQVPSAGLSNLVAQYGTAVNTLGRIQLMGAGNSPATGFFVLDFVQSRGTFSAPSATQVSDLLGAIGAFGFGTSFQTGGGASIQFIANQTYTAANGGTFIEFFTTPNGSVAQTGALWIQASGGVSVGAATDPGVGVLSANTSLQSPLLKGGTAASSSLTIESTSGAGTTDSIIFQTGSQVVAGFINTSQQWTIGPNVAPISGPKLVVNANTLQVPSGGLSGTIHTQFAGAVNTLSRIELIGAGNSVSTGFLVINFLASRGTLASPTATQSTDILGAFGAAGFGTSYQTSGGSGIVFQATETFDATHGGTVIQFNATANGAVNQQLYIQVGGAGGIAFAHATTGAGNGAICGATGTDTTGGQITYQAAAACSASLRQFKRDIEPLDVGLDEVMRLQPRQFYFLPGHGNNGKMQKIGLVADEVEKIDQRLATYDDNGNLSGVDYVYSVTLAFKAIQELKADNDNLRAEIAELRKVMKR